MRNAWRSLARERLQQVLTSTDVEQNLSELRAALAEGEFADLGSSDATEEDQQILENATEVFEQAEQRIAERSETRECLLEAISGERLHPLRGMIEQAQEMGVERQLIEKAKARVVILQTRLEAQWMVLAATYSARAQRDLSDQAAHVENVMGVLGRAQVMGMMPKELQRHMAFITSFRLRHELEFHYNSANIDELRSRLEEAEQMGIDPKDPLLVKVRDLLAKEESRTDAKDQLDKALLLRRRTHILESLPAMIEEGRSAGLSPEALAESQAKVQSVAAAKALQEAILVRDAELLESCIAEAECAGVNEQLIATGRSTMLEEELITVLDDSLAAGDGETMEKTIQRWRDECLDVEVLRDAEKMLEELRSKALQAKKQLEKVLRTPITFEPDSDYVDNSGSVVVSQVVAVLRKFPQVAIEIHGHAMHLNQQVSLEISERRAKAVQSLLVQAGCQNYMRTKGWASHPKVKRKCVRIFPRWAPTLEADAASGSPESATKRNMSVPRGDPEDVEASQPRPVPTASNPRVSLATKSALGFVKSTPRQAAAGSTGTAHAAVPAPRNSRLPQAHGTKANASPWDKQPPTRRMP